MYMRAKMVLENIGFERNKDIKSSLNLGGYTFDNIHDGTIIKVKKSFGLTNTGNFQSYNGATNKYVWGSLLTVMSLKRLDKYYISFRFFPNSSTEWLHRNNPEMKEEKQKEVLEKALETQKKYLTLGYEGFYKFQIRDTIKTINKIGREKFNNMFEIIQPPR